MYFEIICPALPLSYGVAPPPPPTAKIKKPRLSVGLLKTQLSLVVVFSKIFLLLFILYSFPTCSPLEFRVQIYCPRACFFE